MPAPTDYDLFWKLDETSGTVANDSSPNNRDGTILTGTVLGQPSLMPNGVGTSFSFAGPSGGVQRAYEAWMSTGSWTWTAWMKFTSLANQNFAVLNGISGNPVYLILLSNQINIQQSGIGTATSTGSIVDNNPHHIAVSHNASTGITRFYIDGAPAGSHSFGGGYTWQRSTFWDFRMANGVFAAFSGRYQEIRHYSRALSDAEVDAIYDEGVNPPVPDPPAEPDTLSVIPDLTTADFSWVDGGGGTPTGYDVRLNGGTAIDVGLVTTYEFTGLTPNTAYTAEVRAYNVAGDSTWASIGFTTDALAAPTGLTLLGADEDTLTLGWDSHPDAEGFEVRIDGGTPEDVGLTTLHMWDGLDPLTMYDLEVRAYLDGSYSSWASLDGTTETPPGPEGEYVVTLKVGSHEWTIAWDDVLDPDDPVHVLDGLKISWQLNESDPWPAQPQGVTCSVGFYATHVDELDADLAIGTPMSAVLEDSDGNVFATFHGRVTQPQARPIKRKAGLRMLYQLTGDDYTADLYEEPVTILENWPAESADDRMARIVALAATVGITLEPPADTGTAAFEELTAGTTTIGELVADHLRQIVIEGPKRYIVTPVIVDDLLDHFECVLLETTVDAGVLPGTWAIVDGLLTLVFPDTEADGVVDAGDVDLDTTWTRLKFRAINRVKVAGQTVTAEASRGGPPVRLELGTTLTDQDTADLMADLYLPDTDEAFAWVADEFLYYAHRHQEGLLPPWFPDHRDDPPDLTAYVNPLVILRIASNINLAGSTALAGQLSKASVELNRRKILVRFALRRNLPQATGVDSASYEWVYDNFPAVTYADVDPEISYYEARLARSY